VSKGTGDRVYLAIKTRAIAYDFPQGRRIYLEPLARELGVSTTPVREALNRLAAEELAIKAPHKGFIAMTLSRHRLLGHYELSRLLLAHELQGLDADARSKLPEFEPIAGVLYKLNRREVYPADLLASYTAEIFGHIASLGGNADVVASIDRANDHLYYLRTVECGVLQDVRGELVRICELTLAARCEDLLQAIDAYHDTRIAQLPELLEIARRQA
jgi:Bacterial regulatory proteins, gntR family